MLEPGSGSAAEAGESSASVRYADRRWDGLVSVVTFAVPFVLGLFPRVRIPAAVAHMVVGIIVGPRIGSTRGGMHPDRRERPRVKAVTALLGRQ